MSRFPKRSVAGLMLLGLILSALAACGGAPVAAPIRETVVVVQTSAPQVVRETVLVPQPAAQGAFSTPHPILGDQRVRQAIASCTNRPDLITSVYPFLSPEQQQGLLMDTIVPKGHWAEASEGITTYPFDREKGIALLEAAGWTLAEGETVRTNMDGEPLSLSFTTTNAQFRQTWGGIFIEQMAACGIQIVPTYAPAEWWFGNSTGMRRRDFEIGAYGWVGEPDPKGQTLYACNQIPLPSNNWEGQNYMGWCNEKASRAILAANNTLDRKERIKQFAIFQQEFTRDMVSLPLFNRTTVAAASSRVQGLAPNPTEYYTANIGEWTISDGNTLVLGFTQEPSTLWATIESSGAQRLLAFLINIVPSTKYNYDYQAADLKQLPTIENGGASNTDVEVQAGDMVWNTDSDPVALAPGVEIINAAGETMTYAGGSVTMKQLAVTFAYNQGITWEDGEPLKQEDLELGLKIDCDPESGAQDFTLCESTAKVDFLSDTSYTITYLPGVQWPEYFTYTIFSPYPAHQVLSDGRMLADVPAKEWQTLPEITEDPLSAGPYVLASWEKNQRITFTANPNYYKGEPAIRKVVITFIGDTNQAVAQLLTGDVDVLGNETLGAGSEVEAVLKAAEKGEIQVFILPSPTWEHIDFNLFVK